MCPTPFRSTEGDKGIRENPLVCWGGVFGHSVLSCCGLEELLSRAERSDT